MKTVPGSGCTIVWAPDGRTVEKRYERLRWVWNGRRHSPFERERRVGLLLARHPPPVPHARLLAADHRRRSLVYEAVDGEPLGPKFPGELSERDLSDLVRLAGSLVSFRPPAPFLRRFDPVRRVRTAVAAGALRPEHGVRFERLLRSDDPPAVVFGHGDITARNVLRSASTGEAVLIDWEWAAWYPRPWDLAFLWFSLADLPDARAVVASAVPPADEVWFWRSALLVQLLHLTLFGLAPGSPFRAKHERTRDELVERVLVR